MRDVRAKMLRGETVAACTACTQVEFGSSSVLADHYNRYFANHSENVLNQTHSDGTTKVKPISFDYRDSSCNFKCRMCNEGNSTSIENEKRVYKDDFNHERFKAFHQMRHKAKSYVSEILEANSEHRLEEIYWAGGEPLLMERHWTTMNALISSGRAKDIDVRYSTNLSIVDFKNYKLIEMLKHFKSAHIYASIDGADAVGEFLRTGLKWEEWIKNALTFKNAPNHIFFTIDFTLTLPGLIDLKNFLEKTKDLGPIHTKLIGSYTPDTYLSPLALPRNILVEVLNQIRVDCADLRTPRTESVFRLLDEMETMKTFEERFTAEELTEGLLLGASEAKAIAILRKDGENNTLTLEDIYNRMPRVASWWNSIQQLAPRDISKTPEMSL